MDLVASESVVSCSRMFIHFAENGQSFEMECQPSTRVEDIQQRLQALSGVHINDQLLICGATRVEPKNALGTYNLPCSDVDVFLYNKTRLIANCPPPPIEDFDLTEPAIPSFPSSSHPLDDSPDPALKALPSYERQFKYHFEKGRSIFTVIHNKFKICKLLFQRLQVQSRALENARSNIDFSYKMIDNMYVEFMNQNANQKKQHIYYLSNAERNIEKLRHCKLHPALQTGSRKSLLDIVGEEKMRCHIKACTESHKQFQLIVSQLNESYNELKHSVELFSAKPSIKIQEVENLIKRCAAKVEEQAMTIESLRNDLNMVRKLLLECQQHQLSPSFRAHDVVSALGPMYEFHERNCLPKLESCKEALTKLFEYCKTKKQEMNLNVHTTMQKVASFQSGVRDMRYQFSAFKEAMKHQDKLFGELELDRRIGPSYRACLAEVVRRRAALKLYVGQAGQLAEKMASLREMEVGRREEFLKKHSVIIPRDIFQALGLFDLPSQCVVDLTPFDTNLLDIDVSELEYYAPESLVGMLPKIDNASNEKVLNSSSSNSFLSSKLDIVKEDDLHITNDDCQSSEIIGTSKLEVENAWLRAELATAIAFISSLAPDIDYDILDGSSIDGVLQDTAKKTAAALQLKNEHIKHLQTSLKEKERQCLVYVNRISELEQRLSSYEHILPKTTLSDERMNQSTVLNEVESKSGDTESQAFALPRDEMGQASALPEPMDEGCGTSTTCTALTKAGEHTVESVKEGIDENMSDFPGTRTMPQDAAMHSVKRPNSEGSLQAVNNAGCVVANQSDDETSLSSDQTGTKNDLNFEVREDILLKLQKELAEKTQECAMLKSEISASQETISSLRRELEVSLKLLDESQMNCAHLENCLHEAREEAQAKYNALCASRVRLRTLIERLRGCIATSVGTPGGFPESLRSLASSVASLISDDSEDDGTRELHLCIQILADKVGYLAHERTELLERCSRSESAQRRTSKELERQTALVKNLYAKNKLERQVNKEKISFTRFEVHELAAFVRNSAGHYEAINRNCMNYYLSEESIALFVDSLQTERQYIIGQIVHIERNVAREPSSSTSARFRLNPYSLPIGTEYFVVTVAMVPDTTVTPPSC